ncbi:MAG TPA: hypothetical protein VKA67_09165 [Verrucomicrobiae bacterium]|nr:hypothetical protein [Verrucomicrobiae bacterium]
MSDTNKIDKEPREPPTEPPAVFPDLASCRVKRSGFGNYLDCMNPWGWRCPYALGIGKDHLCRHWTGFEILARTEGQPVVTKRVA